VWDSTGYSAALPHTIGARATDARGRSGMAGTVTVQVDNGPTIADVLVSRGLTASSARVTWTTDLLSDGQVEFGLTTAYGGVTPLVARPAWNHEAQLTGLVTGATYHYRVRSRDAAGAVRVTADATFATPNPGFP
jgi:hypothetical protein